MPQQTILAEPGIHFESWGVKSNDFAAMSNGFSRLCYYAIVESLSSATHLRCVFNHLWSIRSIHDGWLFPRTILGSTAMGLSSIETG